MNLNFLDDNDALLTQKQFILLMLWEAIKRHDGRFDDSDIVIISDQEPLHTRGSRVYWFDLISDDDDFSQLVASFNALRGRIDLVFQSEEHYQKVEQEERIQNILNQPVEDIDQEEEDDE